jgi:O-antigen/teichoic acid export membrane protein
MMRSPSGIVVIETCLLALLMFGTYSVLVRVTDMQTIGLWVLINALLGLARIADFWSAGLLSFVGEARGKGDEAGAITFVSTAVVTGALGYLLLVAVAGPLIYALAGKLAGETHAVTVREILPLMLATFWSMALGGVYQLGFLGFGRPLLKAIQTVGGAILFFIAALSLAPRLGLWGILLAQALQAVAMLIYAATVFHSVIGRSSGFVRWQRQQFHSLASFGAKAIAVGGVQLAVEPVIRILIGQFGGLAAVAVLELVSRLIMAVRSVILSVGQILVPRFAREAATVESGAAGTGVSNLYHDVSRLFVLLAVPSFSLMLSAGPLVEEIVFGHHETGLLAFLWLLSAAWITNTIAAPANFLLVGRRRLRPLFWAHAIMTGGSIVLGAAGGAVAGPKGALVGVSLAFAVSSFYMVRSADAVHGGIRGAWKIDLLTLQVVAPLAVALVAGIMLQAKGLAFEGVFQKHAGYAIVIAMTILTWLFFGRVREIPELAGRIRT